MADAKWLTTDSGEEGQFTTKDGTKLYSKEWKVTTNEPPVASVIALHGYSDHCNAYFDFFPSMAARGIEIYSYDQRGWGRTCGSTKKQWGVSGPTATSLSDVDEVITARLEHCAKQNPSTPLFLLGHSAGGALCLTYASTPSFKNRDRINGFIATSPFIRIAPHEAPNALVLFAGRNVSKVMPNMQMKNVLDWKFLAQDQVVGKAVADDPLCHDTGTLKGIADMFARGDRLQKREVVGKGGQFDVDKPILVVHGDKDMVTDFTASKSFVEMVDAKDKTFKPYEGGFHKLHCDHKDTNGKFADDIVAWIKERLHMPTVTATAAVPQSHL